MLRKAHENPKVFVKLPTHVGARESLSPPTNTKPAERRVLSIAFYFHLNPWFTYHCSNVAKRSDGTASSSESGIPCTLLLKR